MLNIKKITLKNFMSVGQVTQAVDFESSPLTLVLGENIDMGGDGARNGVGKSLLIQGICYALYGLPLTKIKIDNLINKINSKNMMVSIDFEQDGTSYRIERGRKPNIFRFIVNGLESKMGTDEAQGDSRETQKKIDEEILGISHTLFKHIVALNTFTESFLEMRTKDQRDVIEELLGIMQLSLKATLLKEKLRSTKSSILREEDKVKFTRAQNERIQKKIEELQKKQSEWDFEKEEQIQTLNSFVNELQGLDIELEIIKYQQIEEWQEYNRVAKLLINQETHLARLQSGMQQINLSISRERDTNKKIYDEMELASQNKCPVCGQDWHDDNLLIQMQRMAKNLQASDARIQEHMKKLEENKKQEDAEKENIINFLHQKNSFKIKEKPETYYETIQETYEHKNTLANTLTEIERIAEENNPVSEQIRSQEEMLQEIEYERLNNLTMLREHEEFLLKLLINKDSFIRKRIIDQNLTHLNNRLDYYLTKLNLNYEVKFINDLSVEINRLGQDFDFGNLSRGERTRLMLGLSWAFRDVFESMNKPINLMFIDEALDSGLDTQGVEAALGVLKKIARERSKNIFLISHRDELISRVYNVLLVTMENGFTGFNSEIDNVIA